MCIITCTFKRERYYHTKEQLLFHTKNKNDTLLKTSVARVIIIHLDLDNNNKNTHIITS